MPPKASAGPRAPERWSVNGQDGAVATLHIPADMVRERRFEIACALTVRVPADDSAASDARWHEMSVFANGAQQWRRRVPSHNPGAYDGLDYRFTRNVPVGQALRIVVTVQTRGVTRRSLLVEADEV